jgi:surface antigen
VIASGPSGSPENADVLPSRRALRARREAEEAAAEQATPEQPNTATIESSAGGSAPVDSVPVEAAPVEAVPIDGVAAQSAPIDTAATEASTEVSAEASADSLTVVVEAVVLEVAPSGSLAPATLPTALPSSVSWDSLPTTAALPIVSVETDASAPSAPAASSGERQSARRAAQSSSHSKQPKPRLSQTRSHSPQPKPQSSQSSRSAPKSPRRRTGSRSPITVLVAIVAIPGLFLTAGLPAYAFVPQSESDAGTSARAQMESQAQDIVVAQSAAHTVVSRDGFSASTEEEVAELSAELRRAGAAAAARASAAEFAVSGIRAEGDDYPWPYEATDNEGGGLSPLGYYYRECVDFVAWRLNRDAGVGGSPWKWTWSAMTPGNGNASGWADAWASKGWPTSTTPVVGAVAWFNYNHVAYVQSIPGDGTVVLEEYNWMGMHSYHTRTVSIGEVPLYLYPPG